MKTLSPSIVVAAGAICWRVVDGKLRVLLVHRAAHQDVSLPKGKVDPGETPPQTAVREIEEETGLKVALGVPLTTIGYTLSDGREKVVHYWAAEVNDDMRAASSFRSNAEIGSLEWVGIGAARKKLSYERDRDVIDRFEELATAGTLKTFALIVLRHAKAVPPASWDGPDATRPLLHRGLDQAASIAPAVAAWRPARILSSPAARCMATVEPLAALTGLPVKQVRGISQDAYEDGTATVGKTIAKRVAKRETVVLCTHGPLLAEIIRSAAKAADAPMNDALARSGMLSTGEFTVLHLSRSDPDGSGSQLVAFETHGPRAD